MVFKFCWSGNECWSSSFCACYNNIPLLGKPTDEMSGPKKGPGCSSYSECHNSELQSLPGLFGEACITSACNMPDSNQHSSSHEHWWLFKSKRNSINMQANWFSWVPVQICLKNQKLPNSKAIYSIFASYLYHSCVLLVFFCFFFCSDLIPVSHTQRALFMMPEGLLWRDWCS